MFAFIRNHVVWIVIVLAVALGGGAFVMSKQASAKKAEAAKVAAAKEHGPAVICVTHDPRLEAFADRVIHIEDGRILSDHRRTPEGGAHAATGQTLLGA